MSRIKCNHGFDETTPLLLQTNSKSDSKKPGCRTSNAPAAETSKPFINVARPPPPAKRNEILPGKLPWHDHHRASYEDGKVANADSKGNTSSLAGVPPTPRSSSNSSQRDGRKSSSARNDREKRYGRESDAFRKAMYSVSDIWCPKLNRHNFRLLQPESLSDNGSRFRDCTIEESGIEEHRKKGLLQRLTFHVPDWMQATCASREWNVYLITGALIFIWFIYAVGRLIEIERRCPGGFSFQDRCGR